VLSAGSLINAIFPLFLLAAAFMIPHNIFAGGQVVIEEVQVGSPAEAAGLLPEDLILKVDGNDVTDSAALSQAIRANAGTEIVLTVQRQTAGTVDVRVVPRENPPPGQGPTGIRTAVVNPTFVRESLPLWEAAPRAVSEYWFLFKNGILGIFNAGSGATLAGPIGIVQMTGEIAKIGISPLFQAAALLSMALAVTNLLPLPALDGGRMVFVMIEWVRGGRRVSPQIERTVHMIGFMLLIGLVLIISYNDLARIISGERLIP
jgi:regulator of sigma E protease